tara:strand:- start:8382 stop:8822 length:441 start_codon:yes stop_codon:yes gene_type:complete
MARRPSAPPAIDLEVLVDRKRDELIDIWSAEFGTKPPRALSQPFLARLLAYDLQVQARGGLNARLDKRLLATAAGQSPKPAAPRLKPGARLLRTWNGVTHRVDVVEAGYRYRDETYKSLSAIAAQITGAHWSGPRFFGLTTRGRAT